MVFSAPSKKLKKNVILGIQYTFIWAEQLNYLTHKHSAAKSLTFRLCFRQYKVVKIFCCIAGGKRGNWVETNLEDLKQWFRFRVRFRSNLTMQFRLRFVFSRNRNVNFCGIFVFARKRKHNFLRLLSRMQLLVNKNILKQINVLNLCEYLDDSR